MGLHTAFTTVGARAVSQPVRWGNNRPGSSRRITSGGKTSLSAALSTILCCGCRLLRFPPARLNTPGLKIQLNVKQRKSCNYPFTDFLSQIFISEVISEVCKSSFPQENVMLHLLPWIRMLLSFM